ncbi:MAG: metal ABC transporter substrate-binding protein [Deltaproteobacteria bacterium]|nr:metal ABC transporter substrate-binding protein [Deltaproteobacteria bacterium]
MKKLSLIIFFITIPLLAEAKLNVVTTIPDLAALAKEVGQDLVTVESLARGDQDPHFLEPKPSYTVKMNRADLLIEVGLQLEVGWLPVLLTQSRNPKIQPGSTGYLDASQGIAILEIPTGKIDRSQGDVHPDGNPHYWLSPRNGLVIARRIAHKLSEIDPSHASEFEQNLKSFENRLMPKIGEWEKTALAFRGKRVVTQHKSFTYFFDWLGLQTAALIEPKPGIPPSPAYILSLIGLISREKIPCLITENYYDPRPSRELSERTGAKVLILPTSVGGEVGIDSYEKLFDHLVQKLKGVL